ncbi:MAG: hypothetical protein LLG01_13155 [Planctomycetaceae bacterium]|nr:hypothetical protein [Planctomycetaceae bacterium]
MKTNLLVLAAMVMLTASAVFAEDDQLNVPLECMKKYNFKEFVVASWCFHNYLGTDYSQEYANNIEACNFNVALETAYMVPFYEKTKVKVLVSTMIDDKLTPRDVWGEKRTHPIEVGLDIPYVQDKYGKSPAVIGYHVGSKYGKHPLPAKLAAKVKQVEDLKAGTMPYVAFIWDVPAHVKAGITIVSDECFGRITHDGFGYDNKGWAHEKRAGYCKHLESMRRIANEANFAFWPMIPAVTVSKGRGEENQGNQQGTSEIRFQAMAPIAYGAQGIMYFGVSTARKVWLPDGTSYKAAAEANGVIKNIIGPRVLGHRSIGVYATAQDKPVKGKAPADTLAPAPGKLIEKMDQAAIAGVLVKEADFKSSANTPHYVMLVNCQTDVLMDEGKLQPRDIKVTFGPMVQGVEIIEADGKITKSGREVSVNLRAGDGRLLKVVMAPGAAATK